MYIYILLLFGYRILKSSFCRLLSTFTSYSINHVRSTYSCFISSIKIVVDGNQSLDMIMYEGGSTAEDGPGGRRAALVGKGISRNL